VRLARGATVTRETAMDELRTVAMFDVPAQSEGWVK